MGVTIWQSSQLSKKIRTRQELLRDTLGGRGVSSSTELSNGWAGGEKEVAGEMRRDGGGDRKAGGGSSIASLSRSNRDTLQNGMNGGESECEEEEEEELTERSLLTHEGGGGRGSEVSGCHAQASSSVQEPRPQNFWLMRLFESKLFDMSIAIGYFLSSKEADVQAYLGNKLFVSVVYT